MMDIGIIIISLTFLLIFIIGAANILNKLVGPEDDE